MDILDRLSLLAVLSGTLGAMGCVDRAPEAFGLTPTGPGATVRYDLGHRPLPEVPLPNDTATWPDPTSRTGLRVNASLVAPTAIERQARQRFSQMEGWGTFSAITVAFDVPSDPEYAGYAGPALDLANLRARHQGDDYDFADDAIYLVDLVTGVPVPLEVGSGNNPLVLRELDRYWAGDPKVTERNLLFETLDETRGGTVSAYEPRFDMDFDGVLDRPNFEDPRACPDPDPVCDARASAEYDSSACRAIRQSRDRCVADNLLTFYERETDTLLVRPLLPLTEMRSYAVVLTDRLVDGLGHPVKSPFEQRYHALQRPAAERVAAVLNDARLAPYFGDLHGSGIDRVAFAWSFTTQPTVDDLKRLRDGLYGRGPFARWSAEYPAEAEMQRMVGLNAGLAEGAGDPPGWIDSNLGQSAGCPQKARNLWIVEYDGLRNTMTQLLGALDLADPGPATELLLRKFDNIGHLVFGTFRSPFLLEGGPDSIDPNAAFDIDYLTGETEETADVVQFWMVVPKETAEHRQPFDVNIFGHGYTSALFELILYAGVLAEHGIATVGINAMGHGLEIPEGLDTAGAALLGGACFAPLFDALQLHRMRDLNRDGVLDSGGDFWSSYLFHTRDGVRQSILDHIQLVRIMRAWGSPEGRMRCRNDAAAGDKVTDCDVNGDGALELAGDFDGNGVVDAGGPAARIGTWGESLGGILSGIHGAIDAAVTTAVPGSGGGGLTDIGLRSFQGGVVEAVLLRLMGPLVVTVPSAERKACEPTSTDRDRCTVCGEGQLSLRWVMPDVNGTGELEIDCLAPEQVAGHTVRVLNITSGEVACARPSEDGRFRVGLPATFGDQVAVQLYAGTDSVESYGSCRPLPGAVLAHAVQSFGRGRLLEGSSNILGTATCAQPSCGVFQGHLFGQGTPLVAPADGLGLKRQSPELRRFLTLAQAALDPGDPISFAPYYALKPMVDPAGNRIEPHAVLTLNTIGDQNVPLNAGIAFARATGALPFLRPDQAALYPEYLDYATPAALYAELGGVTPNQALIDRHVVEGITKLARHPAAAACATSANFDPPGSTYLDASGMQAACFASGCTEETEAERDTRLCFGDLRCDFDTGTCVPRELGAVRCEEALFDSDDLDEGTHGYFEQAAPVPHRLARLTSPAQAAGLEAVWAPRLLGRPFAADAAAYVPAPAPAGRLTALLNAYVVPEGEHTFVNGNPCHAFDHGTYLTRLVARFFQSDGTDLYYLSHPSTHLCLQDAEPSCGF